jgi:hypothetical protein
MVEPETDASFIVEPEETRPPSLMPLATDAVGVAACGTFTVYFSTVLPEYDGETATAYNFVAAAENVSAPVY